MQLLAANNAQTVLASGINASATALTVATGKGALFPVPVAGTSLFKLTLTDAATESVREIMHVTAVAGDVFTVVRGQEGTTARSWSANDIVANMVTAGTLSFFAQLDSPVFIGDPRAPTPEAGDNDTSIATTAFINTAIAAAFGRIKTPITFNASGSYTPTSGVKFIYVEVLAAGGGGGGVSATASGSLAIAGGGGGGGYTAGWFAVPTSATIITVGSGGTGGVGETAANGGGLVGGTGGNSSFGSLLVATGGGGGPGNGTTTTTSGTVTQRVGGLGGVGSGGIVNTNGGSGKAGLATSTANSISGYGGESFYSGSIRGGFGSSMNGVNATLGGGGSGALGDNSPSNRYNGGNGGNGIVRIWEFQ